MMILLHALQPASDQDYDPTLWDIPSGPTGRTRSNPPHVIAGSASLAHDFEREFAAQMDHDTTGGFILVKWWRQEKLVVGKLVTFEPC